MLEFLNSLGLKMNNPQTGSSGKCMKVDTLPMNLQQICDKATKKNANQVSVK